MLASPSIQPALLTPTAPASPEISASGAEPAAGFDALLAAIVPTSPVLQPATPVAALPPGGNPLPVSLAAVPTTPDFIPEPLRSAVPAVSVNAALPQQHPQTGAVLPRALAGTALSRIASSLPGTAAQPVTPLPNQGHNDAPDDLDAATSLTDAAPILAAPNVDVVPIRTTALPAEPLPIINTATRLTVAVPVEQSIQLPTQVHLPTVTTASAALSAPAPAAPTIALQPLAAPIAQATQQTGIKPTTPGLRRSPKANPAGSGMVQPVAQHPAAAQPVAAPALTRPALALPANANPVASVPVNLIHAAPIHVAPGYGVPVYAVPIHAVPIHAVPVQIVPAPATAAPATPVSATPVSATPVRARPIHPGKGHAPQVTQAPGLIRAAARANPAAGLAPVPVAPVNPVLPAEFDSAAVIASAAPPIAKRNPGLNPAHQPATVATDLRIDPSPRAPAATARISLDPAMLRPVPVSDAIAQFTPLPVEPAPAISAYIGPARSAAESAQPLDFAALIGRIESAREAGGNAPVSFSLRHEEFGPVGLRFETEAGRISVDLSSPDPDFARAVAAAQPAASDAPRNDNGRPDSGRSDNQRGDTSARGQESTSGNARDGGGTGRGSTDERGNRQPDARRSATGAKPTPDQTDLFA